MRRQLVVILVLFVLTLLLMHFLLGNVSSQQDFRTDFPTTNIFVFNAVFSLVLLLALTYLSLKESFKDNLGFLYLASVLVKPILFILFFKGLFFSEEPITQFEAILMLLPTLTSLFYEVLYCSKILKDLALKKNASKD